MTPIQCSVRRLKRAADVETSKSTVYAVFEASLNSGGLTPHKFQYFVKHGVFTSNSGYELDDSYPQSPRAVVAGPYALRPVRLCYDNERVYLHALIRVAPEDLPAHRYSHTDLLITFQMESDTEKQKHLVRLRGINFLKPLQSRTTDETYPNRTRQPC